ncbi:RHS repeat-associated core domain-containing protein [Sulfuricurvum sp.]|uniref:RHS repeat-associated core domain-containing protein n=1 Tax=Sulfuricurvum sp. TaxID=2025608 RepID=UPI00261F3DEF|nr:RHS repeat-associated core domain-containing protein [Sulfuricurvum sp.]MDD4950806.1 peptidoglycan DD-metalloendopeptidase family protein [Sulfuricurvum sp.]
MCKPIKYFIYHRDHQNSIIALSDDNAQIVEYYEYDIYGTITKAEYTEGIQTLNPYRYTGREFDTDDLYYYRARYYDPTIGRFITPDPIGFLSGDTNFYRYVGNDPVNFNDPSGLQSMAIALASAVQNRPNSSYDGNPFNGIIPDTSVPKTAIPNSTMPQGKTNTQTSKPKAAQVSSKTAQVNKQDGVKIKGDVPKVVDEKCKDQKWHDPVDNPQLARYTKGGGEAPYWNVFGHVRKGRKDSKKDIHQGVDLFALPGTPVYACVDGIVTRSEFTPSPYGNVVTIKAKCPDFVRSLKLAYNLPYVKNGEIIQGSGFNENGDFYFFYAHLLEINSTIRKAFDNGERVEVKAGQIIGKVGTSGYDISKDPHLHFEVLNINKAIDLNNRVNPGFYVKYKLPNVLKNDEAVLQQGVANSKNGDPRHGDPLKTK